MKPWVELYQQHTRLRSMNDRDAANEVRKVLRRLSERPCSVLAHQAQARLIEANDRAHRSVTYTLGHERNGEALNLNALSDLTQEKVALKHARLTVLLRFNRQREHLQELNVMLAGERHDDSPWALAVHLPHDGPANPRGDREGLGACGHAALHCHAGAADGDDNDAFEEDAKRAPLAKLRVPFPPLRPAQIVEWVMSQVVPTPEFEPAPWPEVKAMLPPS